MKLYFVRHAESTANKDEIFYDNSKDDIYPLTDIGREQAVARGEKLKNIQFKAAYSSTLLRAFQTASLIMAIQGIDVIKDSALNEFRLGRIEGLSYAEGMEDFAYLTKQWMEHRNFDHKIENGESFNDVMNRFFPFIRSLEREYPPDSNILIVGHGGTFRCMLPMLLENIDFEFVNEKYLKNTEVVVAESVGGAYICRQWGEYSF